VEKYGRVGQATGGNTIWRMCIAYWITKATDTTFNTYCFSTATVVTRTRLNLTLCIKHIACLALPQCLINDKIFGGEKSHWT
jgi:hypothetical protein